TPDPSDPLVQKIVQEIRCGFPFVLIHAGNLGFYGSWNTLLAAAKILSNETTGLVFVGGGADRDAVGASAADLPNVRFVPFRPASEIPHVMGAGGVHMVTVRRGVGGVGVCGQ